MAVCARRLSVYILLLVQLGMSHAAYIIHAFFKYILNNMGVRKVHI